MGSGKTAIITPLIITSALKHFNLIFIVLPGHLVKQTYDAFQSMCNLWRGHTLLLFSRAVLERTYLTTPPIFSMLRSKILTYTTPITSATPKSIVICDDSSYKNLTLWILEKNSFGPLPDHHASTAVTPALKSALFNGLHIMDEFDSLFNPSKSDFNIVKDTELLGKHPILTKNVLDKVIDIALEFKNNPEADHSSSLTTILSQLPGNIPGQAAVTRMYLSLSNLKDRVYDKDFGFPSSTSHLGHEQHLAVPYVYTKTPVSGVVFTDLDTIIAMTIFAYLKCPTIREIDAKRLFGNIFVKLYPAWKASGLPPIIMGINMTDDPDDFIPHIQNMWRSDRMTLLKYYLLDDILPGIKYTSSLDNISHIDMISWPCKNMMGFSGTININLPVTMHSSAVGFNHPHFDGFIPSTTASGLVNLGVLNLLEGQQFSRNLIFNSDEDGALDAILMVLNTRLDNHIAYNAAVVAGSVVRSNDLDIKNRQFNALIDCAAFLKNFPPETVARSIATRLNRPPHNALVSVVYISASDTVMQYIPSVDKSFIYKFENGKNVFTYFDDKHSVGIDIQQNPFCHGLLTVGPSTGLSIASQAMYRLRNINYGHTVEFIIDDNPASCIGWLSMSTYAKTRQLLLLYLVGNDDIGLIASEKNRLSQIIATAHRINQIDNSLPTKVPVFNYFDKYVGISAAGPIIKFLEVINHDKNETNTYYTSKFNGALTTLGSPSTTVGKSVATVIIDEIVDKLSKGDSATSTATAVASATAAAVASAVATNVSIASNITAFDDITIIPDTVPVRSRPILFVYSGHTYGAPDARLTSPLTSTPPGGNMSAASIDTLQLYITFSTAMSRNYFCRYNYYNTLSTFKFPIPIVSTVTFINSYGTSIFKAYVCEYEELEEILIDMRGGSTPVFSVSSMFSNTTPVAQAFVTKPTVSVYSNPSILSAAYLTGGQIPLDVILNSLLTVHTQDNTAHFINAYLGRSSVYTYIAFSIVAYMAKLISGIQVLPSFLDEFAPSYQPLFGPSSTLAVISWDNSALAKPIFDSLRTIYAKYIALPSAQKLAIYGFSTITDPIATPQLVTHFTKLFTDNAAQLPPSTLTPFP
jgi:hypothetical protein